MPKGYQISQYDEPLCVERPLPRPGRDGTEVGIVRAHLEEDAAKNVHLGGAEGRISGAERDARRLQPGRDAARRDRHAAGPPLRGAGQALPPAAPPDRRRARDLRRGDGEGVAPLRRQRLRSARGVGRAAHPHRAEEHELVQLRRPRAIEREIERQIGIYESGGEVEQETLHFDPGNESAPPLRSKEEAQDYRYFPEPDLVPIEPPAELVERAARRAARSFRAPGSTVSPPSSTTTPPRTSSRAGATRSTSRCRATGGRSRTC